MNNLISKKIPVNWKKITLGDHLFIKHGFAFKGECFTNIENENVLLTPGNFHIGGGFKFGKFKYCTGEIPEEYVLKEDDLIITMTDLSKDGDTLGYPAKVPKLENKIFLHNQRLGLVKFLSNDLDSDFLYWLLCTKKYQKTIVNSASGSTVRHTSPTKIQDYSFLLPPLPEQRAIANVLSAFDNKIALLRRQNKTLEAIAQAIFKEWFVHFNFPNDRGKPYKASGGDMTESELGEIPEGWSVKSLEEIIELIGGGTPKTSIDEYWTGNIPWFSVVDVPNKGDIYVIECEKKITELGLHNSSTKILPINTTIITARGTVGKLALTGVPMAMNQSCYGVRPKDEKSVFYTYQLIKNYISELKRKTHGAVFDTITRQTFSNILIPLPINDLILKYEQIVNPIYEKILQNNLQIKTLTNLRDTLLPKLTSGEVKVNLTNLK